MISMIAAMTLNRVIGVNGHLPWRRMKSDMQRFREITMNKTIVMGRGTFESIGSKPLPNRNNIVLSKTMEPQDGIVVIRDTRYIPDNSIIVGGQSLYEQCYNIADYIYLTVVDTWIKNGDAMFNVPISKFEMIEEDRHKADSDNDYAYTFFTYRRICDF